MSAPAPESKKQPLAGDDRNIVEVSVDTPSLTFEEQLQLFWIRYQKPVLAAAAAVILAVAGKTGYDLYQEQARAAVSAEFATIADNGGYLAFADQHPDSPLAAVGLMRIADEHFSAGRYPDAITAYGRAASLLPSSDVIGARARLSGAMATILNGQPDAGRQQLAALADDAGVQRSLRAQAAYQHAVALGAAGDADGLKAWVDKVASIDVVGETNQPGPWAQRAQNLRRMASQPAAVTEVVVQPAPALELAPVAPAPESAAQP